MKNCLKIDNTLKIIEGVSIGGIDFTLNLDTLKYTSKFRISCGYEIILSISNDLILSINFISEKVTIYYDLEFGKVSKIKASNGYVGSWNNRFIVGKFRLSDILEFDWTFEQMTPGMITSEKFKGIGFLVPDYIKEFTDFEGKGKGVSEMVKTNDFVIEDIVIFSKTIGDKNLWEFYEPFVLDKNIQKLRYESNYINFKKRKL